MAIAILQNAGAGKPGQHQEVNITENGMMILAPEPGYSLDYASLNVDVKPGEQKEIPEINENGEQTVDIDFGTMTVGVKINANVPSAKGDRELIDGSVTAYTIPEDAKKIRDHCFFGCAELSYVQIPDSVKSIGAAAFWGCTSLTSITIPDSVTSIGDNAFDCCSSIKTYDFTACTVVPNLGDAALEINEGTKIIVPYALYEEWIETDGWGDYKDYIVTDISVPSDDNYKIYASPRILKSILDFNQGTGNVGEYELKEEHGVEFLHICSKVGAVESFATVKNYLGYETGQYLAFKYRAHINESDHINKFFEVFANTTGKGFANEIEAGKANSFLIKAEFDGNWHTVIVDVAEAIATGSSKESTFISASDGTYKAELLRIDWFNCSSGNPMTTTDSYVDIAYVAMCDDLATARNADMQYTGAEFDAEDLAAALKTEEDLAAALKTEVCYAGESESGIDYVAITDKPDQNGERYVELYDYKINNIVPNTSRYVGVLYRTHFEGGSLQVYVSSSTSLGDEYVSYHNLSYDEGNKGIWSYKIFYLADPNSDQKPGGYKDSICRRVRLDYFNGLGANEEYSMDIAFIKFFTDEKQAREYCEDYMKKYGLNQEET